MVSGAGGTLDMTRQADLSVELAIRLDSSSRTLGGALFPAFLFHKGARSVNHEAIVDHRVLASPAATGTLSG